MQVDQAVFASAITRRARGYQLVSRSPRIEDNVARQLCQWSPSHGSLIGCDPEAASLNWFQLAGGQFALSRAFYGGPEYSRRGGLQVVTHSLILRREQLFGYDDNPLAVARVAFALGYLHLKPHYPSEIPKVDLPDDCIPETSTPSFVQASLVEEAIRALASQSRIALVIRGTELDVIETILLRLPRSQRLEVSFSSGLKPSMQRLFRLHTLPSVDTKTRIKLSSFHIQCIDGTG